MFSILAAALILKNVAYAPNGSTDQVMDVFWTSTPPKAPVLFIHGGSLQETGERRMSAAYADVCRSFVAARMACASMDYRLAPAHGWPAMPDDVASAIVKLRQIIRDRGGDPQRLFVFGHSSGCHLAAIVGTNPEFLKRAGLATTDLAGIIAMGCTLDREDAALRGLTAEQIRVPFSHDAGGCDVRHC